MAINGEERMNIDVQLVHEHHFVGTDVKHNHTHFDSRSDDVAPAGPSPVSAMLQSLAACSGIDVVDILKKKRKTITSFSVHCQATRAEQHPKVFTSVHMHYRLTSPDTLVSDLERCIHLSHETYCSVSAMFVRSGCTISHSSEVLS